MFSPSYLPDGGQERLARILLVEDDAEVGRLLEHILVADRYEVDRAKTVEDACTALAAHQYDLLVAEVRLPDGTGMTVADCAAESGIKTLIITGYGFAYPELRNYDYLLKPVRPAELLTSVRSVLRSPALALRNRNG
jgi:DNA-binding response OmpR family regulator